MVPVVPVVGTQVDGKHSCVPVGVPPKLTQSPHEHNEQFVSRQQAPKAVEFGHKDEVVEVEVEVEVEEEEEDEVEVVTMGGGQKSSLHA